MNFPDNNGGFEYQTAPQRRGGCSNRLLLMMIVFGIAMFIFRSRAPEQPGAMPGGDNGSTGSSFPDGRRGSTTLPPISPAPSLPGTTGQGRARAADSGDWSIEEVDSTGTDPVNDSTKRGDWSIEEVETQPNNGQIELELGQPAKPKKTEKGDWSLEEVPEKIPDKVPTP